MTMDDHRLEERIATLEELVALQQRALEGIAKWITMSDEREEAQQVLPKLPFTRDELLAIAETFHDAVKDVPESQLYASIEAKAEQQLASAQAANKRRPSAQQRA